MRLFSLVPSLADISASLAPRPCLFLVSTTLPSISPLLSTFGFRRPPLFAPAGSFCVSHRPPTFRCCRHPPSRTLYRQLYIRRFYYHHVVISLALDRMGLSNQHTNSGDTRAVLRILRPVCRLRLSKPLLSPPRLSLLFYCTRHRRPVFCGYLEVVVLAEEAHSHAPAASSVRPSRLEQSPDLQLYPAWIGG